MTVRAAVKVAPERTELRSFERPRLGDDCGLLRIEAAGVGGSDPEFYRSPKHLPAVMGHENVGVIDALGPVAEERWGLKVGDRIALHEYLPCHHCRYCMTGNHRLCPRTDIFGGANPQRYGQMGCSEPPHLWGGFAEYLHLPPQILFHRVPEGVEPALATLAVPLGNGWQWAVLDGGAGPGKTVVVFGPGQQGLGCTLAARSAGAEQVILIGKGQRDKTRLALGLSLGADHVLDSEEHDLSSALLDLTGGRGVDVVVDTTGDPDGSIAALSIQVAAPFAQLNLNGLDQAVPLRPIKSKSLVVRAPRGRTYRAVELALAMIASRRWPIDAMCTHHFALDDVHLAILSTAGRELEGVVHAVVEPWG